MASCPISFHPKPTRPPPDPVSYTPIYLSHAPSHSQILYQKPKVSPFPLLMLFPIFFPFLAYLLSDLVHALCFWSKIKVLDEVNFFNGFL